jgi:tetratricopeptide (TPR) repeat protein/TolB-like protein/predicted Ser/Thr protein kinase
MEPDAPDARLSNYRLDRLLGSGGMGSVYLARDLTLHRDVAIKFIAPELAGDETARRRLLREARAAAALDHPNICGVHEIIVTADGRACIVMQYVEGETLAEALRRGPLDSRQALGMAADLASALAAAHQRGIIHRDLKPQNVMLTPSGRVKLLDFGIARIEPSLPGAETESSITGPGTVAGTPAYMSPEQIRQQPPDARSDLYSLGAVLYEALTGRRAANGATMGEICAQILDDHPPPPSLLRPGVSAQHDELLRRLMAKHPEDRFSSAEALAGALRVLLPDTAHAAATGAAVRRDRRAASRVPMMLALAGALALAALLVALAGTWIVSPSRHGEAIVGVLPFANEAEDPRFDLLIAGLPDALAERLGDFASLRVLPSAEIREALAEEEDPVRVSRSLGARFLIEGTLESAGPDVVVLAGLIGPDGLRTPAGRHAYTGNPLELHRRLAGGVIDALGQQGLIRGETAASAPQTEDAEAFAEYSQAKAFVERPDVPGNLDHAIRLFESAIARDPRFALAHAGLAEAYWVQFRETRDPVWTGKALASNLEALRIDPGRAEVRLSLAVMYQGQGRHEEAIEELTRVLRLQPRNDNAHRLMATIHMARGEWEAAIDEASRAVALRPSYWRNHGTLGQAHFRAGRFDEAARAYQRVVELQPDSSRGYQWLGAALQAAGRNDEAIEQYGKAIAIGPSWGTYSNIGTLYFWRGEYRRAADAYERAIALSPNRPQLHANLGDAYGRLGQPQHATAAYRQALRHVRTLLDVSPNDATHLAELALYQSKLGRQREAADALAQAVALSPNDGEVLLVGAIVHALQGEIPTACALLGDALERGASREEVRHSLELHTLKGCEVYDQVIRESNQKRGQ